MKKRSSSTKSKIINAAWKLFYEKGYDDTTIEDIVSLSETSKGSFYHYFEGKDALLGTLATLFDGSGGSSGTNAIYFLIKKMLAKNAAIPAQKSVNFLKKLIRFRTPVKNTLARYYYTLFFALFQYPRRYLRKKAKKR